ncbi:MAG: ketoacyl-ACP synthase III [Neisseriaceae bacterium]|nr:ketoacyl-ACP synthase III [Neisseriaceae bacterium]
MMVQNMALKPFTILGGGVCLPAQCVRADDLDRQLGLPNGTVAKKSGAAKRYFLSANENADDLIIQAAQQALKSAHLSVKDIDCVIDASATMRQALPFNAANVCRLLGLSGIPAFDVNMTCLGALQAMAMAANLFSSYRHILITCCDIASVGLNAQDLHSFGLFGDGAAALVVSASETGGILAHNFAVFPDGYHFCEIQGGGWLNHPTHFKENTLLSDYARFSHFKMDGKRLYRLTADVMPDFLDKTLQQVNLTLSDIDFVVPHQASRGAIHHLISKLHIPSEKIVDIFDDFGNQVAVSLPHALIHLLSKHAIKGGEKVLLAGTSAGLGLGAIVWQVPEHFTNFQAA